MAATKNPNPRAQPAQTSSVLGPRPSALAVSPSAPGPRPSPLQAEGLAPAPGPWPSPLQAEGRAPAPGPRPSALPEGSETLRVGGVTPLTTIDYPGELAAVLYCQGCPWRCRYCQNGHLLERRGEAPVAWSEVLGLLRRRRGLLDAVVFSGGEPTLQRALPAAMQAVRELGFKVGLHTAGCYPDRLQRVLPLVDWVGLDVKALPQDYPALTGVPGSGERAWASLDRVRAAGIPYQVRVTVHARLLPAAELDRLCERLAAKGVSQPVLQACQADRALDPGLRVSCPG